MIRTFRLVGIAVGLLFTAVAPAAQAQAMEHATQHALVTVSGTARERVVPDELTFSFAITTEGENLLAAKAENTKRVNDAIAYLKKAGVDPRDIRTEYLNIHVDYVDQRQLQARYRAHQTISVRLRDIARFDEINTELLQRGITGINGPNFASSQRDSILERVRLAAALDARRRATALAEALGQRIGPAHAITDVDRARHEVPVYRMAAMDAESSGGGIASGELLLEHSVTVAFYLYTK